MATTKVQTPYSLSPDHTSSCSSIPKRCPATYRRLNDAEYAKQQESTWAETRTCAATQHKALHARVAFSPGDDVCSFSHRSLHERPNYLTVQTSPTQHILLSPSWLQNINHGCQPNVFFNTTTMKLQCLRPIAPGDELCFFYPSTEWEMDAPFPCLCGTPCCLGTIQGAKHLKHDVVPRYRLNDHIHALLNAKEQ